MSCGARDAAFQLQAAFDQPARAGADHVARGVQRDRRQALAIEHEIERVDQVGRGVDERAVEIEYDGAERRSSRIAIGPRSIMQDGQARLLSRIRSSRQGEGHAGVLRQDGIRDRRAIRHRAGARARLRGSGHERDACRYRAQCPGIRPSNSLHDFGPNVRGVGCDVADPGSVERAAKAAFEAFGHVHVVCNNAGVAAGGGIDNISLDNWRWVIDVNLMGVLHGIRSLPAAYPRARRGRPHRQHRVDGRA